MAPSGSDKKRTAAGVGLATSILLSPQNPKHTALMGFGKFFTLPSTSSSSNNSSRPQASYRPPPGPGISKADYAYGLDSSDPKWSAQNYPPCDDDAPPAYSPKKGSDHNDWATDSKMPAPQKPYESAAYSPSPSRIQAPTKFQGEDPLQQLKYYDIVIILDDSWSMTEIDRGSTISRWEQVCDGTLPPVAYGLPSWSEVTNTFVRILGMGCSRNASGRGSSIRHERDRYPLPEQSRH